MAGAKDGERASAVPADLVVEEVKRAGGTAIACVADIASEGGSAAAVALASKRTVRLALFRYVGDRHAGDNAI
jgi:hypothetical protein